MRVEAFVRRRLFAHGLLAGVVLGLGVLFVWPPESSSWYPGCPSARYLRLLCPGCGATRALSAILHGRFAEALRWNPLFVGLLPFFAAGAVECYRRALRSEELRWPQPPSSVVYSVLLAALIFMAERNGLFLWL